LAHELGVQLDLFGDILPSLAGLLSNGTQFIADCGRLSFLSVVRNAPGSRRTVQSLLALGQRKGAPLLQVVASSLGLVFGGWAPADYVKDIAKLEQLLVRLLNEADSGTRAHARDAAKQLEAADRPRYEALVKKLDPRKQKELAETDAASPHQYAARAGRARSVGGRSASPAPRVGPRAREAVTPALRSPPKAAEEPSPVKKRPMTVAAPDPLVFSPGRERAWLEAVRARFGDLDEEKLSEIYDTLLRRVLPAREPDVAQAAQDVAWNFVDQHADLVDPVPLATALVGNRGSHARRVLDLVLERYDRGALTQLLTALVAGEESEGLFHFIVKLVLKGTELSGDLVLRVLQVLITYWDTEVCVPEFESAVKAMAKTNLADVQEFASTFESREDVEHFHQIFERTPKAPKPLARVATPPERAPPRVATPPDRAARVPTPPERAPPPRGAAPEPAQVRPALRAPPARPEPAKPAPETTTKAVVVDWRSQLEALNSNLLSGRGAPAALKEVEALLGEHRGECFESVMLGLVAVRRTFPQPLGKIVTSILSGRGLLPFVAALQKVIDSDQPVEIRKGALDMLTASFTAANSPGDVLEAGKLLAPSLTRGLGETAPEIRKAVIFALVEIRVIAGPDSKVVLDGLTRAQLRLLDVYYERRAAKEKEPVG
jgi:hypothetical protein